MPPSLASHLSSPFLYQEKDGGLNFVHDTYRDFFLGMEIQNKLRSKEFNLPDFYDKYFDLLGGFDRWKHLSEFLLEMIEDSYTPSLIKRIRDDPDLRQICTIEQFLPNGIETKTLVQVNDYYCTYKAQKVILEMEKILIQKHGIRLILREGLAGPVDVSCFAEFSDPQIKAEVCDYFMKKGKINADEALAITGNFNFVSWGVEDAQQFKQCHESKSSGEGYDVIGKVEANVRRIFVGLAIHDLPDAIFVYGSSFKDWFIKNVLINNYSYIRLNPIFEGGRRDEETYQEF